MSSEQQLNSLDRFRKHPGRLVLEAHSHCEVPAGCGGVVLRWRNPQQAVPLIFHLYAVCPARCLLDGQELAVGRMDIPPGPHVLGLVLQPETLQGGLFMFAAVCKPPYAHDRKVVLQEAGVRVTSAPDRRWQYTLSEPPADWLAPGYSAPGWGVFQRFPTPKLEWNVEGAWACRHCADEGALFLGLNGAADEPGPVWVRRAFEVPLPE